jgi:hypothetical protein
MRRAKELAEQGVQFTCEDLALTILIEFASSHGLPLTITNESGSYNAASDDSDNRKQFLDVVLKSTGASDLQNPRNTTETSLENLAPGDLILHVTSEGVATHTQVVTTVEQGLIVILQGNFNWLTMLTDTGSADPNSPLYVGTGLKTAVFYFDSRKDEFIFVGPYRKWRDARSKFNLEYKSWNFLEWK